MIAALLRQTLTEPRAAARRLLALDLPLGTVWIVFALVMVLGMILGLAMQLIFPVPREILDQAPLLRLQSQPLLAGSIQAGFLSAVAWVMAALGRRFGGGARFDQTLLLVAWMEFVLLVVQVIQILATLIVPPVATLIGFAGFGLFFLLLTTFTAEANGFRSLAAVFMGVLVSLVLAATLAAVFFAFLGWVPVPQSGA